MGKEANVQGWEVAEKPMEVDQEGNASTRC